jgi:hypothetical protein
MPRVEKPRHEKPSGFDDGAMSDIEKAGGLRYMGDRVLDHMDQW